MCFLQAHPFITAYSLNTDLSKNEDCQNLNTVLIILEVFWEDFKSVFVDYILRLFQREIIAVQGCVGLGSQVNVRSFPYPPFVYRSQPLPPEKYTVQNFSLFGF